MKPLTSHCARKTALGFPSLVTLSVAAISHFATPSASAADRTWSGGDGDWTNAAAGGWSAAWSSSNDTATFTGAGGIVTLTTDITVRTGVAGTGNTSLRFNGTGDYTLSAASALTLTLNTTTTTSGATSTPATRAISVAAGRTATVGANVTITTRALNLNQVFSGADLTSKWVIESGGTIKGTGGNNSSILSLNDITVEVKSGGTLTTTQIGTQFGQPSGTALFVNGDLKVLGGNVTSHGTLGLGQATGTAAGNLTLTTGGNISAVSANGIRFGSTSATVTTAGGTIHLDGGTLSAFRIFKGGSLVTTSVLNLNGGLLQATATADGTTATTAPNFIESLARANVRDGGAKIDSAGFNLVVTQDLLHSDNIADLATDGGLTKSGLGSLTLTGNNTYTGATTVSSGTLVINGNSSAATGAVNVNDPSTLGGNGTLGGTVTLAAAANLSPGATASVGTLSILSNLDVSAQAAGTGKLIYALDTVAASDKVAVTGTLNIGTAVLNFSDFTFSALAGLQNGTYKLITSSAITGSLDTVPANLTGTLGAGPGIGTLQLTGGDLELLVTGIAPADPYLAWAGVGVNFDADANNDGVQNGLAWLLGAASPSVSALGLLPTIVQSGGSLQMTFSMLNAASRGASAVELQHSSDLGISDPWTSVLVPDTSGGPTSGVTFVITPGSPLNGVQATISSSESAGGKLFGRLKGIK